MDMKKETAAGAEGISHAERSGLLGAVPRKGEAHIGDDRQQKQEKKGKDKAAEAEAGERKRRHPALRGLFWTLRKGIVPAVCVVALIGGMYIGYSVLGKRPGGDVFQWDTWKHMYDLVFAES